MQKTIICCFLIAMQLFSLDVFSADEVYASADPIVLTATDHADWNIPEGQQYGSSVGISSNQYIAFDITLATPGRYHISALLGAVNSPISLTVNDISIVTKDIKTGSFNTVEMIELETVYIFSGVNRIQLKLNGTGSIWFQQLKLECLREQELNYDICLESGEYKALYDIDPENSDDSYCDKNDYYPSQGWLRAVGGEWVIFQLQIVRGGKYALYFNQRIDSSVQLKITAGGSSKLVSLSKIDGNFHQDTLGDFELAAGVHELKIEIIYGTVLFKNLLFEFISDIPEDSCNFSATAYTQISDNTVIQSGGTLLLAETEWASYTINAAYSGYYRLILEGNSETAFQTIICLNGRPATRIKSNLTGIRKAVGYVLLEKGESVLQITAQNGDLQLKNLYLSALPLFSPENIEDFTQAVNVAEYAVQVKNAVNVYFPLLQENSETWLDGIFYSMPIFEDLVGRNFDNVQELMCTWYDLVQSEKRQPRVALKDETGNILSALQSGNLSLEVHNDKIKGDFDVIAAIYCEGRLNFVKSRSCSDSTDITMPFDSLQISPNINYDFKLFYWNAMQPVQSYDNIYLEIYLSPEGNDNNGLGTKNSPYQTLNKAKSVIAEQNDNMSGDILIHMETGEYYLPETEYFSDLHSGKNGYHVIFKGTNPSEPPVIHGGVKVTNWAQNGNGIWIAPVEATEIRNLYVDGITAYRARSKNYYVANSEFREENSAYEVDGFKLLKLNFPVYSNPKDIELVWNIEWTCQRLPVSNIQETNDAWLVYMEQPFYHNALSKEYALTTPTYNKAFYVENAFECLDSPGEFYYSKPEKKIYYYPYEGQNPNVCDIYYPSTELLFSLKGQDLDHKVNNIIFDNLTFRYGAYNTASSTGVVGVQADKVVDGENNDVAHGGKIIPSQFTIENAEDIEILNCRFEDFASGAISMVKGVSDSKIIGNVICDTAGTGIIIGSWDHNKNYETGLLCKNIDIKNNVLRRNSTDFRGGTAISVYYADSINILHNDIKTTPYSGISLGWGWGEEVDRFGNLNISYNRIEDVMYSVNDGGHIYTLGPMKNSVISNNYLKTSHNASYGGIYLDSGSAFAKINRNVIEESPFWFLEGTSSTHELYAYENYSDTSKCSIRDSAVTGSVINEANQIEARRSTGYENIIKEKAGLEADYTQLLSTVDTKLPDNWENALLAPTLRYYDGVIVEAEDYTNFYKLQNASVAIYNGEYGTKLVGDTKTNEWLEYSVNIPETADYNFDVNITTINTNKQVNFYIDNVLIAQNLIIPKQNSWNEYTLVRLASNKTLSLGFHTFKVKFVDGGCSLDYFAINTTKVEE